MQSLFKTLFLTAALALPLSSPLFAQDAQEPLPTPPVESQRIQQQVDVVFVIDTTGSMAGLIEGAKRKVWAIANTIIDQRPNARIRIGLVAYRDIGDEYVTRAYPLSTDIQGIYGKLLSFQADGGGDTPESVNEALDVAVGKQPWVSALTPNSSRILFLVGDAPPHMDYQQDRKYPEIIKAARQKGIIVNAVQAGDMAATRPIWQEIAQRGGGEYIAIPQDGGRVVVIDTPYDNEIIIIQKKLNATVIPYGSRAKQSEVADRAHAYESAPAPAAADMSSYVNKSGKGKAVITGGGDLVAEIQEGRQLADIPPAELPPAMQKMSRAEQTAYIARQTRERDDLSRQLAEKVRQRDAFMREADRKDTGKQGDSFDRAVARTLEKQIK